MTVITILYEFSYMVFSLNWYFNFASCQTKPDVLSDLVVKNTQALLNLTDKLASQLVNTPGDAHLEEANYTDTL